MISGEGGGNRRIGDLHVMDTMGKNVPTDPNSTVETTTTTTTREPSTSAVKGTTSKSPGVRKDRKKTIRSKDTTIKSPNPSRSSNPSRSRRPPSKGSSSNTKKPSKSEEVKKAPPRKTTSSSKSSSSPKKQAPKKEQKPKPPPKEDDDDSSSSSSSSSEDDDESPPRKTTSSSKSSSNNTKKEAPKKEQKPKPPRKEDDDDSSSSSSSSSEDDDELPPRKTTSSSKSSGNTKKQATQKEQKYKPPRKEDDDDSSSSSSSSSEDDDDDGPNVARAAMSFLLKKQGLPVTYLPAEISPKKKASTFKKKKRVKLGSSNIKKNVQKKAQKTKPHKESDDASCSGTLSSNDKTAKTAELTLPPEAPEAATKVMTLSDMAALNSDFDDSDDSSAGGDVPNNRKVKFVRKTKEKVQEEQQPLPSQNEFEVITPASGCISTWEMREKFKREFPDEPVPSDAILRQLYKKEKLAEYERQERFQKDNPREPVPSDEVLKKLYQPKKTTTEDDPAGAKLPKDVTTPTPLRREQLTRQDSELSFSTEAPWDDYGQSSEQLMEENNFNFTGINVMLSVEEEGDEEDVEIPIKFDGDARDAWRQQPRPRSLNGPSKKGKSNNERLSRTSHDSSPDLTWDNDFHQSFSETPSKRPGGTPKNKRSSIERLEKASENQRAKSQDADFDFASHSLNVLPSNNGTKEDDVMKAFHESFNGFGETENFNGKATGNDSGWATDFELSFSAAAEPQRLSSNREKKEKAWYEVDVAAEETNEGSQKMHRTPHSLDKSGHSLDKSGHSMDRSGHKKSRSRDPKTSPKPQQHGKSRSRDKSHHRSRRGENDDESLDEDLVAEKRETSQRKPRRTVDMNSSGHLSSHLGRPRSRDGQHRKNADGDSVHSKSKENSVRARRTLDSDKSGPDSVRGRRKEPTRGVGRTKSECTSTSKIRDNKRAQVVNVQEGALEEFFAEAQETGRNDGIIDQTPGRNDGFIDQTPATPRIQPSDKERRRARSADGSNIRAAFEDQEEGAVTAARKMKTGCPATPGARSKHGAPAAVGTPGRSRPKGNTMEVGTPGRSRPKGNTMAASNWMAEIPSHSKPQPEFELQFGSNDPVSPLTVGTKAVRPTISARRRGVSHL